MTEQEIKDRIEYLAKQLVRYFYQKKGKKIQGSISLSDVWIRGAKLCYENDLTVEQLYSIATDKFPFKGAPYPPQLSCKAVEEACKTYHSDMYKRAHDVLMEHIGYAVRFTHTTPMTEREIVERESVGIAPFVKYLLGFNIESVRKKYEDRAFAEFDRNPEMYKLIRDVFGDRIADMVLTIKNERNRNKTQE